MTPSPTPQDATDQQAAKINFTQRLVTGITLLPIVVLLTFWGGVPTFLLAALVVLVGTLEFYHMEKQRHVQGNTLLGLATAAVVLWAFYIQNSALLVAALLACVVITFVLEQVRQRNPRASVLRVLTTLFGVLYIAIPFGCLLVIRAMSPDGLQWLYVVMFATWGTDTFAYLVGRMLGKTPLAPRLSPSKTLEGAIGGIIAGACLPALILIQMSALTPSAVVVLLIAPFVAVGGDLLESALKRFFSVKDSGIKGLNLFPGHGGVLDRIDALLWVSLFFYGYLALMGKVGF